jgi:hypothetical protein
MVKKHTKKCSPSLAIKEMQIQTTLRFHLTPVRMASIKNTTPTNAGKDTGEKEPSHTAGGNVSEYNHFGKQYGVSLKTKHRSAI